MPGAPEGARAHALGRSRGGLTTKVHMAVDALGLPIRFAVTPGQWAPARRPPGCRPD